MQLRCAPCAQLIFWTVIISIIIIIVSIFSVVITHRSSSTSSSQDDHELGRQMCNNFVGWIVEMDAQYFQRQTQILFRKWNLSHLQVRIIIAVILIIIIITIIIVVIASGHGRVPSFSDQVAHCHVRS